MCVWLYMNACVCGQYMCANVRAGVWCEHAHVRAGDVVVNVAMYMYVVCNALRVYAGIQTRECVCQNVCTCGKNCMVCGISLARRSRIYTRRRLHANANICVRPRSTRAYMRAVAPTMSRMRAHACVIGAHCRARVSACAYLRVTHVL